MGKKYRKMVQYVIYPEKCVGYCKVETSRSIYYAYEKVLYVNNNNCEALKKLKHELPIVIRKVTNLWGIHPKYLLDFELLIRLNNHLITLFRHMEHHLYSAIKYFKKIARNEYTDECILVLQNARQDISNCISLTYKLRRTYKIGYKMTLTRLQSSKGEDEMSILAKNRKSLSNDLEAGKLAKEIAIETEIRIISDKKIKINASPLFKINLETHLFDTESEILAANNIRVIDMESYRVRLDYQTRALMSAMETRNLLEALQELSPQIHLLTFDNINEDDKADTTWYVELLEKSCRLVVLVTQWLISDLKRYAGKFSREKIKKDLAVVGRFISSDKSFESIVTALESLENNENEEDKTIQETK